jgi:hypothetical protein
MGCPSVTFDTFWNVYSKLVQCFHDTNGPEPLMPVISSHFQTLPHLTDEKVALLEGMKELRQGGIVVGQLPDIDGGSDVEYASFTSSEDDAEEAG